MRFRKGDKVEVLNMCEVPSGSWRCATIISGNGRRYIVTYVERSPEGGFNVGRVPRNAMRPIPPPVGGLKNLLPDDIVEVFGSGSWKVASVIGTVDGMYFFVRPHGSGQELCVHKTNLRLRQSWQDGQWFVVGKGHQNRVKETMTLSLYGELPLLANEKVRVAAVSQIVKDCKGAHGSSFLKRKYNSNSCNADLELACKVSTREGEWKPAKRHHSSQLEKVDAFVSPRVVLGEKSLRNYFNNELFETEMEESVNSNSCRSCFSPTDLEPNETLSRLCSMNNNDANRLELHAYRSTMEELCASGVISWEQEILVGYLTSIAGAAYSKVARGLVLRVLMRVFHLQSIYFDLATGVILNGWKCE